MLELQRAPVVNPRPPLPAALLFPWRTLSFGLEKHLQPMCVALPSVARMFCGKSPATQTCNLVPQDLKLQSCPLSGDFQRAVE